MDVKSMVDTKRIVRLDGTNYSRWKLQIGLALKATKLWDIVNGTTVRPAAAGADQIKWDEQDIQAQALIVPTLSERQTAHIYSCTSSHEMYARLKDLNSDSSIINRNQTLTTFFNFAIGPNQNLVDAFTEMEQLWRSLTEIGTNFDEATVVTRLVSALPEPKYQSFKKAWDSVPMDSQTMVMLLARFKKEGIDQMKEESSSSKGGRSRAFAANDSKNLGQRRSYEKGQDLDQKKKNTKCHICLKTGHWKRECTADKKRTDYSDKKDPKKKGEESKDKAVHAFMGNNQKSIGSDRESDEDHRDHWRQNLEPNEIWYSDSGANQHISGNQAWFITFEEFECPRPVYLTDTSAARAIGKGTVQVEAFVNGNWDLTDIKDVLYIPGASNLFSEFVMVEKGFKITRNKYGTRYWDPNGKLGPVSILKDDMFQMKFRPKKVHAFSAKAVSGKTWHKRLAHVNPVYIRNSISSEAISGIPLEEISDDFHCSSCELGKHTRQPFKAATHRRCTKPGEMTHMDTSGKMPAPSLGHANYFVVFVDDATGFVTVNFVNTKDEIPTTIMAHVEFMECQTGNRMKRVRSDNGTEFVNSKLEEYFQGKGIIHERAAPYCPESNGRAERQVRTLKDTARTMMQQSELPEFLWAEAVATGAYVRNRLVNKQSPVLTPFEQVFGKKPFLGHVRVFGSKAFAHVPDPKRKVWDPKAKALILVGYDPMTPKKYKL